MADFDFAGAPFDPSRLTPAQQAELESLERTVHISGHRVVIAYYAILQFIGALEGHQLPPLPIEQRRVLDLTMSALRMALGESGVRVPRAKILEAADG